MSNLGNLPRRKRPYVYDHAHVERPENGAPWYVWIEMEHMEAPTKEEAGEKFEDLYRFAAEKLPAEERDLQLKEYEGRIFIRARSQVSTYGAAGEA